MAPRPSGKAPGMEIHLTDPNCRVRLVENPRARRFVLRLASDGDGAVLTYPPGVPRRDCESFLNRHTGWLRKALDRTPQPVFVAPGIEIPVDGELRTLSHEPGRRSGPELGPDTLVVFGRGSVAAKVSSMLKARARDRLAPAVHRYAEMLDRRVTGVSMRDTRSRWGSCASTGAMSFSWRLAMAPPEIQDYVAAHEAAHLVEMNHSDRYWAVLERVMPEWRTHRTWLKREGRGLHRYLFRKPDQDSTQD